MFEIFIDIGHYVRDIGAYEELVSKLNLLKVNKNLHIFKKLYSLHILTTRKAWNILYLFICHLIYNQEDELKQIAASIESMNQNKAPTKHISNYAILEHLGSGAFGSVYKVNFPFHINLPFWGEASWRGSNTSFGHYPPFNFSRGMQVWKGLYGSGHVGSICCGFACTLLHL